MIVRTWHGVVPAENAEAFREHLLATGVAEARGLEGNLAAYIYNMTQSEYEHFFMVSYWRDMDAVRSFAGSSPHIAVTYPEDSQYGLISDPIVLHHEVEKLPDRFPCP